MHSEGGKEVQVRWSRKDQRPAAWRWGSRTGEMSGFVLLTEGRGAGAGARPRPLLLSWSRLAQPQVQLMLHVDYLMSVE